MEKIRNLVGQRNRALKYNADFQLSFLEKTMSKERLLQKFTTALKEHVVLFFEHKEMYDHKYILNSKITVGSTFERNPLIHQFQVYNMDKLPLTEIILGEITSVIIPATGRLAVWSSKPKMGKELNSFVSEFYSFSLHVNLTYDKDSESISVSSLDVR